MLRTGVSISVLDRFSCKSKVNAWLCAASVLLALAAGIGQTTAQAQALPRAGAAGPKPEILTTPKARINAIPSNSQRFTVRGSMHTLTSSSPGLGPLAGSEPISGMQLVIQQSGEQKQALEELIMQQQDPGSPNFHNWVTPEEFGAHFGAAGEDLEAASAWLSAQGFTVNGPSRGRLTLDFSGTAAQVEAAFQTKLHHYLVNGEQRYANSSEIQLPAAFSGVVAGVRGINNFRAQSKIRRQSGRTEQAPRRRNPQAGSQGGQQADPMIYIASLFQDALTPADYRVMFNVPGNLSGSGIRIGIPELSQPTGGFTGSPGNAGNSDYANFNTIFGLPSGHLSYVIADHDPGVSCSPIVDTYCGSASAAEETSLDIQWAHAMAPQADLVVSLSTDLTTAIRYLIDNNLADILNISWSSRSGADNTGDATHYDQLAAQAAAQGISIIVGSGDWGSVPYTGVTIGTQWDWLTSNRYTTSVGGTDVNSGLNAAYWWGPNIGDFQHSTVKGHIPEDAWSGSGGGSNPVYPKPAWQTGVPGIPSDGNRNFPDVSLPGGSNASYLICENGSCSNTTTPRFHYVSGTSASGPAFAGIAALLGQKWGGRQGLLNPTLYKLGSSQNWGNCNGSSQSLTPTSNSCIFYDITTGSNAVPGQAGYGTGSATYNAGTGYDMVTGLGSVNASALINSWANISYKPSTVTMTLPLTGFYGFPVNVSGQVTGTGGTPGGIVTIVDNTGSRGSFQLDGGGNFSGQANGFPIGTQVVKAIYSGDAAFARGASTTAAIIISKTNTTLSASITNSAAQVVTGSLAYGAGSYTLNVTAVGANGYGVPTGNAVVSYTKASTGGTVYSLGSFALTAGGDNASGVVSIPALAANATPDTYTFTISYGGDTTFNAGTPVSAAITIAKATSVVAVASNPTSAAAHSSVQLRAVVAVQQTTVAPGGTVQFYQNGVAVGSPVTVTGATIVAGGYTASVSLNTTALLPGTDNITAIYSGDANNASSTSPPSTVSIQGYATTGSVSADHTNNVFTGTRVNLTATILSQQTTPALTGSVQFFVNNGISLGSAAIVSGTTGGYQSGRASLDTYTLPAGTDAVYAVYSGDSNYNPGTSFPLSMSITQAVPNGSMAPAALTFPTTSIGVNATSQQVTLWNSGSAAMTIGTVSITGANPGSFSQTNTCTSGGILQPYTSGCFITVTFNPQTSGTLTANLVVTDNSASSPHTTTLTGTGIPAGGYLSFSATQLTFANQTVSTSSAAQTFKISNIGNLTVTGIQFTALPAHFTVDTSNCGASLAPAASCTVSVTFAPVAAGADNETIPVQWTAAASHTTNIALTGAGAPVISVSSLGSLHQIPGTFTQPAGVVADAKGNVYVSDTANNAVYKIDPMGNQTTLPIVGLTSPGAMTMDQAGNIYVVSNGGVNNISVIKYNSPAQQTPYLFSGATQALGVAVSSAGKIYISNPAISSLWVRGPADTGATQVGFAALGLFPSGTIAIDSNDALYVAGTSGPNNIINKLPNLTGTPVLFATLPSPASAMAVGLGNNIFAADSATNQVTIYSAVNSTVLISNPALSGLSAVFTTSDYNTYLVSGGNHKVFKSSPSGQFDAGLTSVGSTSAVAVTLRVPAGNSVSTLAVTDLAGNSEWSLPTGNTCTVAANLCSFNVNFTPAYPGQRDGTLTVLDGIGHTLTIPLFGTGAGPQSILLTGSKTTAASSWKGSVARSDSAGNVYVLDQTNTSNPIIQKIATNGATSQAIALGPLFGPVNDFALDGQGNFAVKPGGNNTNIYKAFGGAITGSFFSAGTAGPFAIDNSGSVYDGGGNQVTVYDYNGNLTNYTYGAAATLLTTVVADEFHNFYVATNEPAIYRTSYLGTTTKLLDSTTAPGGFQLSNPTGLAVDASGSVYTADAGANALFHTDPSGNTVSYALHLTSPTVVGVTVTPQGALFLSDAASNNVFRFDGANTAFTFGTTPAKVPTAVQSVLLLNSGNSALTVTSLPVPTGYQIQQDPSWCSAGLSLAPGANCDISLMLNPSTLGALNGSVPVTTNSLNLSGVSNTISLSGNSVTGSPATVVLTQSPNTTVNALTAVGIVSAQLKDVAGFSANSTDTLQLTLSGPAGFTTITRTAASVSGAASFDLSASTFTVSGNYTLTLADSTSGTVTPATLAITANALSQTITFGTLPNVTYGSASINLNATASSGLSVGYSVTGPASLSGSTLTITGAGPVSVTASQPGNGAYSAATSVVRTFNVQPAQLTVKPTSLQKYINQANPAFRFTITGYVNGDAVEVPVVFGGPSITTTAVQASPVGTYPITATLGTLTAANYTFTFVQGTLSVVQPSSPITPAINWPTPSPITYGTALSATQLNATADTLGGFTYNPAAGAVLTAGTQTLNTTFTPSDVTDYTIANGSVSLVVNQATPTIQYTWTNRPTAANTQLTLRVTVSPVPGGATPTGTVSVTMTNPGGSVNLGPQPLDGTGSATFTSTLLAAGYYTAAISYSGNTNYTVANSAPTVNVVPAANIGSSTTYTLYVKMAQAGQLANIGVFTGGAAGLDFTNAGRGTCAPGATYAAGAQCSVVVTFAPRHSGQRPGAVVLTNAAGAVLSTTYVSGIGIGSEITYQPATETTLGTGYQTPSGIAVDAAGNVYVSNTLNGQVIKLTYSGGSYTPAVIATCLYPMGVAVDAAGNVYISESGQNRILIARPSGSGYVQTVLPTGTLNNPHGLWVDSLGNLYIADMYSYRIVKETFTGSGYVESVVTSSTLSNPQGVAVDSNGNVYIADTYNNRILKETPNGSGYTESAVPLTVLPLQPAGLAVDGNDNLYIAAGFSIVKEVPNGSAYIETVMPTVSAATPGALIAIDGSGNLYIVDPNGGKALKENYATPPSLSFVATAAKQTSPDSPKTVTVFNTGNAPLQFSGLAASSADYQTTGSSCSPVTNLAAGASCNVAVSFTPQQTGLIPGTMTLTDNALNAAGSTQLINLSGTGSGLSITPATVPGGKAGTAYSQQLTASGGTASYTFTLNAGSLPTNITLSPGGLISGTTSATGSYPFTVKVTDSLNAVGYQSYTLLISGATPATVTLGNTNQKYLGTPQAVTVVTVPAGLAVAVTYNGSATVPVDPGSYNVVATVTDPAYLGSASGTLVIAPPSSSLTVTTSGLAYSRVAQTYSGTLTIHNTGSTALPGPFRVVFTNLPAGVTLANLTGTLPSGPYLDVASVASLGAGASVTANIQFKNPSNVSITFTPVVY